MSVQDERQMLNARHERAIDLLRRFFRDDFASTERRDLWAEDGVFEMPFAKGGPMVIRGRDAIYARSQVSYAKFTRFRFTNVRVIPTAEENVYVVLCGSESIVKASGQPLTEEYVNFFTLREGQVSRRIEYFNPIIHP